MSDIGLFCRYPILLLICDSEICRLFFTETNVVTTSHTFLCHGINTLCLILLWCPTGCIHKWLSKCKLSLCKTTSTYVMENMYGIVIFILKCIIYLLDFSSNISWYYLQLMYNKLADNVRAVDIIYRIPQIKICSL